MVIITKHGEFECKDITRLERRKLYRKVKKVFNNLDKDKKLIPEDVHDLADQFALIAFGSEKKVAETLKGLSALAEDEVLMEILNSYMGFQSPSGLGG